jgi:hypothetical protein
MEKLQKEYENEYMKYKMELEKKNERIKQRNNDSPKQINNLIIFAEKNSTEELENISPNIPNEQHKTEKEIKFQ